jgi:tetratricopeptide (TPR) repeat protein
MCSHHTPDMFKALPIALVIIAGLPLVSRVSAQVVLPLAPNPSQTPDIAGAWTSTLPIPVADALAQSWVYCASEGGFCNAPPGAFIHYGLISTFAHLRSPLGGLPCNNGVFGDPLPGAQKACLFSSDIDGPPIPTRWAHCATEGGFCNAPSGAIIHYGLKGAFADLPSPLGGRPCNNGVFGDPLFGVHKECFFSSDVDAAQATVSSDPKAQCDQKQDLDLRIQGCSAIAKAADASPHAVETAWIRLGWAYSGKAMYGSAIDAFNQANKLNPSVTAYIGHALASDSRQAFDDALQDVAQALKLDPKNAGVFVARGMVHSDMGKRDEAFRDYDDAIKTDPKNALGWYYRADWYADNNQLDLAVGDFNEAIRLDPSNWVYYNDLGRVRLLQDQYQEALNLFSTAVRLSNGSSSIPSDNYRIVQSLIVTQRVGTILDWLGQVQGGWGGGSNDQPDPGSNANNARQLWDQQRSDDVSRSLGAD